MTLVLLRHEAAVLPSIFKLYRNCYHHSSIRSAPSSSPQFSLSKPSKNLSQLNNSPDFSSPYLTDILFNSSISVSKDSIKDQRLLLEQTINDFISNPFSIPKQEELEKLLVSHQKSLSHTAFIDFSTTVYFMLIGKHVYEGDSLKAIQSHRFLTSLTAKNVFFKISNDKWLEFLKTVLSVSTPQISDTLFDIHRLQPKSATKGVYSKLVSWMYFSKKVQQSTTELWIYRLILSGDYPSSSWDFAYFEKLLSPGDCTNILQKSLVYRYLVRQVRRKNIDFVYLSEIGILTKFAKLASKMAQPLGFNLVKGLTRAILRAPSLSPKKRILPTKNVTYEKCTEGTVQKFTLKRPHPILESVWSAAIDNNIDIPPSSIFAFFEQNNLKITPIINERLMLRSKNIDKCQPLYNDIEKSHVRVPESQNKTLQKLSDDIVNPHASIDSYGHIVKLLCRKDMQTVIGIMQHKSAYSNPTILNAYLYGLTEIRNFKRIIAFCEEVIPKILYDNDKNSSENPPDKIKNLFWGFYLNALAHKKRFKKVIYYLTAILSKKSGVELEIISKYNVFKDRKGQKNPMVNLVFAADSSSESTQKLTLNSGLQHAILKPSVFNNLSFIMLYQGRSIRNRKKFGETKNKNKISIPQIIKILRLGYSVKIGTPYQLSPIHFSQFLRDIQKKNIVISRREFMVLVTRVLEMYPFSYQWKSVPPGVHFNSEYFSSHILRRIIYIGILLGPSKPWWVLAFILYLNKEIGIQIDKNQVKTIFSDAISQIYGYSEVSGELKRVRNQLSPQITVDVLLDTLNLVWDGYSLEEIDAMLKYKDIHTTTKINSDLKILKRRVTEVP